MWLKSWGKELVVSFEDGEGKGLGRGKGMGKGRGSTFWICLFHFWTPILTLTVLFMRPEETTTAFICREAEAASFWMCCDMFGARLMGGRWSC